MILHVGQYAISKLPQSEIKISQFICEPESISVNRETFLYEDVLYVVQGLVRGESL